MKKKIIITFLTFFCTIFLSINLAYSQNLDYCGMDQQITWTPTLYKPPITGQYTFNIIIVYVMFNNETFDENNSVWPANTTSGPSYKGTMLAQNINLTSDWWNAYNTETQSISSWFCEASRGQLHVTGSEYFVKLNGDTSYYQGLSNPEDVINREIYDSLTAKGVTWSNFDKWKFNPITLEITREQDYKIDMIYKIHRYKYSGLLPEGYASGFAYLGQASNTSNPYDYAISQGGQIWHILGGFPNYISGQTDGSGVTVVGNASSGILNKTGVFGRVTHEHGHWFFDANHFNYTHMGPNDASDYFFSPWERITLGYIEPYIPSFDTGYAEIVLDDFSARSQDGIFLIKVPLPDGSYYLIANRSKISKWDRVMLGDTARGDPERIINYGQGIYIYHIDETYMDMECADGLWNWVHDGWETPDWGGNSWLPVLKNTIPVRNYNDNGEPVCVDYNSSIVKDGRDIQGLVNINNPYPAFKYFSIGERTTQQYGTGIDRIFTNKIENWCSREYQGDRWDAWQRDYNEIFSPYSSPSTLKFNNDNSGIFIYVYGYNTNSKQYTIRIYLDGNIYQGGMQEADILAATPPSRPMGLKIDVSECENERRYPVITWAHNIEPDMLQPGYPQPLYKRYKIFRAWDGIDYVPGNFSEIADVLIHKDNEPSYTDYNTYGHCANGTGEVNYRLRYKVKAVDNTNLASVYSDFVSISTYYLNRGNNDSGNPKQDETLPKSFALYQNFPNPFNPVTKINYDLPKDSKVSLVIYDILGREIVRLINDEFKTTGRYIVDFNGSNFASGVYFCRLVAGNFISVKRMVLIK